MRLAWILMLWGVGSGCAKGCAGEGQNVARPPATFPDSVAGLTLGMDRARALEACQKTGQQPRQFTRTITADGKATPTLTCPALPEPMRVGRFSSVEVMTCDEKVCVLKLTATDASNWDALRAGLDAWLGPPRRDDSHLPEDCAGAALPACLHSGKARFWFEWGGPSGFPRQLAVQVVLTRTATAQGEYVLLSFADPAGKALLDAAAR